MNAPGILRDRDTKHSSGCIEVTGEPSKQLAGNVLMVAAALARLLPVSFAASHAAASFCYLLLLLRPFWHCRLSRIAVGASHFLIAIRAAALVIRVKLFSNLGFGISLEVLINALVILVCTTAICGGAIITGCKIFILQSSRKDCSGLQGAGSV